MKTLILLVLSFSFFSCSKDTDNSNKENETSYKAFFNSKIDNNLSLMSEPITNNTNSYINSYDTSISYNYETYQSSYSYISKMSKSDNNSLESISLKFNNLHQALHPTLETSNFYTYFINKPTNFSGFYDIYESGLEIIYRDINGISYSTKYGSQENSTITYSSSTNSMNGELQTITITGSVNCKLYNSNCLTPNSSDYKILTEGVFKLTFIENDN